MKNPKAIQYYKSIMICISILTLSACSPGPSDETTTVERRREDRRISGMDSPGMELGDTTRYRLMSMPVSFSDYITLTINKYNAYSYMAGAEFTNPTFVEPYIKWSELSKYLDDNAAETYTGLRFYPQFNSLHKRMYLVMCIADKTSSTRETAYVKLNKTFYSTSGSLPAGSVDPAFTESISDNLNNQYLNKIKLFKNDQSSADSIRKARIYEFSDLYKLIADNKSLVGGDENNLMLRIEIGYIVGGDLAEEFASEYNSKYLTSLTNEQIQGFTVMLSLTDLDGATLMDEEFDPDESGGSYLGGILEVGSPCPPLCGNIE